MATQAKLTSPSCSEPIVFPFRRTRVTWALGTREPCLVPRPQYFAAVNHYWITCSGTRDLGRGHSRVLGYPKHGDTKIPWGYPNHSDISVTAEWEMPSQKSACDRGCPFQMNRKMADDHETREQKTLETIKLSCLPSYPGGVSWSLDDRISVIADQCVYILVSFYTCYKTWRQTVSVSLLTIQNTFTSTRLSFRVARVIAYFFNDVSRLKLNLPRKGHVRKGFSFRLTGSCSTFVLTLILLL